MSILFTFDWIVWRQSFVIALHDDAVDASNEVNICANDAQKWCRNNKFRVAKYRRLSFILTLKSNNFVHRNAIAFIILTFNFFLIRFTFIW